MEKTVLDVDITPGTKNNVIHYFDDQKIPKDVLYSDPTRTIISLNKPENDMYDICVNLKEICNTRQRIRVFKIENPIIVIGQQYPNILDDMYSYYKVDYITINPPKAWIELIANHFAGNDRSYLYWGNMNMCTTEQLLRHINLIKSIKICVPIDYTDVNDNKGHFEVWLVKSDNINDVDDVKKIEKFFESINADNLDIDIIDSNNGGNIINDIKFTSPNDGLEPFSQNSMSILRNCSWFSMIRKNVNH